jgi:hypothetical protein
MYVDALRKEYSSIDEVWLMGPRVNAPETRGKEWDLLAFADTEVLEAIRDDRQWHREDLCLLVVVDGDRYQSAWGESCAGRLSEIDWRLLDAQAATYLGAADGTLDSRASRSTAVRVR